MSQRLDYMKLAPQLTQKMLELSKASKEGALSHGLIDLINIRASQLNGCAFCLDMHVKEAKIHGERELRVHHISVWRESTLFSAQERAALELTEAVTRLTEHGISDEIFARVQKEFSPAEVSELVFAIGVINSWNRLAITFRSVPGSGDVWLGLSKAGLS